MSVSLKIDGAGGYTQRVAALFKQGLYCALHGGIGSQNQQIFDERAVRHANIPDAKKVPKSVSHCQSLK